MESKLQKIKDEYARERRKGDWNRYYDNCFVTNNCVDEIARRYAFECCKASLEKAAHSNFDGDMVFFEEITDEENIVLL